MIIIHDERLPEPYVTGLREKFPEAEFLPFGKDNMRGKFLVYESILYHPDIFFCQLENKTLVHAPCVNEMFLGPLRERGVELIKGEEDPEGVYPGTCGYNAFRLGAGLFHNLKYTDKIVAKTAERMGLQLVDVSQGYSRCSSIPVKDNGVITADMSIKEAAEQYGLEVLLLSPGSIVLPGQEYGFIGGASGIAEDGKIVILGDIDLRPERGIIRQFLDKYSVDIISFSGKEIFDAGSLLIFD